MKCPDCNATIDNGAVICGSCNASLPFADVTMRLSDFPSIYGSANDSAGSSPDTNDTVHGLLTQANLCRLRSQWPEAIDFCVAVLRIAPADLATHSLLGDIYRDQGKLEDAIQWYRMAVDLGSSPIDIAKLEKAEIDLTQLLARRSSRSLGSGKLPPMEEDGIAVGTVNLMGISPQRWLRAITLTSITCAALMVIGLFWLSKSRHHAAIPAHPPTDISSDGNINSPGQNISLSPEAPIIRAGAVGGQGFRPDSSPNSSASGNSPAASNIQRASRDSGKPRLDIGVSPAPVNRVAPLPSLVEQDVTGVGDRTAAVSLISRSNPLTLSTGMNVIQAVPDRRNGSVAIQVAASYTSADDSSLPSREQLVRTCFRAGKAIFDSDSTLARATITISIENSGSSGENRLVVSEVDRGQVYASSPETDPSDLLEKRLSSFHLLIP